MLIPPPNTHIAITLVAIQLTELMRKVNSGELTVSKATFDRIERLERMVDQVADVTDGLDMTKPSTIVKSARRAIRHIKTKINTQSDDDSFLFSSDSLQILEHRGFDSPSNQLSIVVSMITRTCLRVLVPPKDENTVTLQVGGSTISFRQIHELVYISISEAAYGQPMRRYFVAHSDCRRVEKPIRSEEIHENTMHHFHHVDRSHRQNPKEGNAYWGTVRAEFDNPYRAPSLIGYFSKKWYPCDTLGPWEKRLLDMSSRGIGMSLLIEGRPGRGKSLFCHHVAAQIEAPMFVFGAGQNFDSYDEILLERLKPGVVVFDDVDRASFRDPGYLSELMGRLERMKERMPSTHFLFTVNYMELLDEAFCRPGRIDAIVRMSPPGRETCERIIRSMGEEVDADSELLEENMDLLVRIFKKMGPAGAKLGMNRLKNFGMIHLTEETTWDALEMSDDDIRDRERSDMVKRLSGVRAIKSAPQPKENGNANG